MKANKGCWEDCGCMGQAAMLEVYCTALTYSDILEIVMAFGPGVDIRSLPLT